MKIIDALHVDQPNQHFGTCELCEYVADDTDTYLIFELEDGSIKEIPTFHWDWGDKWNVYISNIPAFAAWFNKLEDPTNDFETFSCQWLDDHVFAWEEQKNDQGN